MKVGYEKFVDEKIALISKEHFVIDMGGGKRFQKWLAKYEPLFTHANYKTFDNDPKSNPDIVGDIHKLPLTDGSVDAIICSSVLEHVHDPIRAVEEMYRVLRPEGKLFLYVPSIHPYHIQRGVYGDHWRFFDDTLKELCKPFQHVEIQKRGGHFRALSLFIPPQRYLGKIYRLIAGWIDTIFQTEKHTATTEGYYVFATK